MSKYHFNEIETKWQKYWADNKTFKAYNDSDKPKYYVLDMFPYPSGAGLHVGHPLGYIASDVYSRFKRHQGFNVLHPMGYDSFGLPAEQYAIQTGQHPANTTRINIEGCLDENGEILSQYVDVEGSISEDAIIEKNIPTNIHNEDYQRNVIKGYRKQMDKIGFSFDWDREVRTSNPEYYKWTQWIFLQLFESWYDKEHNKARAIEELRSIFSSEGNCNVNAECDADLEKFTASEWLSFEETKKQEIFLKYRLTYLAETEVNWCPQLGTVLANDEIVNGVSERGGYPVVRKKMKQWSMRITAYAQRLLDDLEKVDWPQPLKDSQTNWIGRSKGASVSFKVLPPAPSGGGGVEARLTGNSEIIATLFERAKEMRNNPTKAEAQLWKELRNKKVDYEFRQQHPIDNYIVDFVCLEKKLIIEVDGEIHDYQVQKDGERELLLKEKKGFKIIRFSNNEVLNNLQEVLDEIKDILKVLPSGEDLGGDFYSGARGISVFTTRPDTIFGVSFMVLAPEHDLVSQITTAEQKAAVENYVEATAKRSERDRMSDVKTISGVFTGAYAEHPFSGESIPVWIGDYVLAGYGTGAVMSVPCGDQRDYDFAKHFNIPIPNIFKDADISEGAYWDKENTIITNSDFLDGLNYQRATDKIIAALEEEGVGEGKINYRLRDAVFSRQRYWGEPFPIYYKDGMPHPLPEESLPLHLPAVEKYLPTEEGEPPLGRADVWAWDEENLSVVSSDLINNKNIFALELNTMPGWAGSSWYFFRYMEEKNRDNVFASKAAMEYWKDVDLYIGGSEHATGHLLYSRFWVKFLYDRGLVPVKEPFKKLINQGMILGESAFVWRINGRIGGQQKIGSSFLDNSDLIWPSSLFVSYGIVNNYKKIKDKIFDDEELHHDFVQTLLSIDGNVYQDTENILELINRKDDSGLKNEEERLRFIITKEEIVLLNRLKQIFVAYIVELKDLNEDYSRYIVSSDFSPVNITISFSPIHSDVSFVNTHNELDVVAFKNWRSEYKTAEFITDEDGTFKVSREVEKMSKSKYNVVNPDDICEQYGADTLRMYEMFLGPLEQAKPWSTAGISGVHNFLKKLWKLYHSAENENFYVSEENASKESLKVLHKTIKKVEEDIKDFSFNTSVSTFMIAVNELSSQKCTSREILESLVILISPYAPHIAEELWEKLGHDKSISKAQFPKFDAINLVEDNKEYPISFNGKMRFTMELPLDLSKEEIESAVMSHEKTIQYLEGRTPKKVIVVPGKIVNIVG